MRPFGYLFFFFLKLYLVIPILPSGSKQLDAMAEMQHLSDSLHSALNIAEEPQTGSPSSCPTDSPRHSDHDDAEDKAQWKECMKLL